MFQEQVSITTPNGFTYVNGSSITGAGTVSSPWQVNPVGTSVAPSSAAGNVRVTALGTVSTFTVTLRDHPSYVVGSGSNGHSIDLFNVQYLAC